MRVCQICQRPRVVDLSSHLAMALDECFAYLKRAIMCRPATLIQARLPNTKVKPKLKKIRQARHG